MPRRDDLHKIMIIGSGPIVIGQACEFDYSGTQACEVLKAEGYEVVLVNSNPATIMTDPKTADRTYVEPITAEVVAQIIAKERPDAILPNMGGQTALNCAVELAENGTLDKYGVEMIGCDLKAIQKGEDRKLFAEAMKRIGLEVAKSGYAYSVEDAEKLAGELGFPLVLRPSFTLGGAGGGIAYNIDELREIVRQGLELSPAGEVLVEESIIGWKEYEMEVMRDHAGNGIIVCSIENLDPMGVHTGDSITVAPAQTLSDLEYQRMRVASLAILEKIGVETGGSNVQFAVNPNTGRLIVIEMNPRVSRSSALASKATGFPIAKAAARLAVGYTLDEIVNDITKATPACFEPTIDYCVVKVPRFAFEKFKGTDPTLTTRMKAVGEIMAIGRTFEEAFGKAMRSLEDGHQGICAGGKEGADKLSDDELAQAVATPTEHRIFFVVEALRRGWDIAHIHAICGIDPWYLNRINDMVQVQESIRGLRVEDIDADAMRLLKQYGTSDAEIAALTGSDERFVRAYRKGLGVVPSMKTVDTCAAGFGAPHIRQRLYWVADADGEQLHRSWFRKSGGRAEFADGGGVIGLADTAFCGNGAFYGQPGKGVQQQQPTGGYSFSDGLGNTVGKGLEGYAGHGDGEAGRQKQDRSTSTAGSNCVPLPTDGFWRNADWLLCRDGKWRPVEPGSCPLAHGTTARVGRLRGYGNAIVAPQAEAFIRAFMEWENAYRS